MTAVAAAPAVGVHRWHTDLAAAVPGWVAARVVVALAWLANHVVVGVRLDGEQPVQASFGLWAWDGAYYRDIAELGYAALAADAIRFHPLLPLVGWNRWGILAVANVAALLAAAAVHRLVVVVLGDADAARRSATLVSLAPPAFCLVWAYAEGPFLVVASILLLALHHRRWWAVAALGLVAVALRPSGLLLAVPALVEAAADLLDRRRRAAVEVSGWLARVAAVVAPAAGMAGFLWWAGDATGDSTLPIDVQASLRGGFALPPLRLLEGFGEMVAEPFGDGLHFPFALGMVALAVVAVRRLPPAWAALAVVSVLTNLAAENLNSIERYAYGTVPILVALAVVAGGRWWRPTVALGILGLFGLTVLAWYGSYVP